MQGRKIYRRKNFGTKNISDEDMHRRNNKRKNAWKKNIRTKKCERNFAWSKKVQNEKWPDETMSGQKSLDERMPTNKWKMKIRWTKNSYEITDETKQPWLTDLLLQTIRPCADRKKGGTIIPCFYILGGFIKFCFCFYTP